MQDKSFGQIAFEAYCESVGNKTYDSKPIPEWEDLKEEIKQAWNHAAEEAIKSYAEEYVL